MKIAIITLPLHTNYGGILQAYALQTVLERMGHRVNIVTRSRRNKITFNLIFITIPKRIVKLMLGRWEGDIFQEIRQNKEVATITKYTERFISKYIHQDSRSVYEIGPDEYDAFVVGSDQIWRPLYMGNLHWRKTAAFLDFTTGWNVIRIAYAASFGTDEWTFSAADTKDILPLINRFDAVSVREKSAVSLCKRYFHINATQVLDPTMLLPVEEYLSLINRRKCMKRGLVVYFLDETVEKLEIVDKVVDKTGLAPVFVSSKVENHDATITERINPPVENWISGFANADFVVTDSFHGCVFSIIFKVPFVVVGNRKRGIARVISLLESFNLLDHLIFDSKDLKFDKDYTYNVENELARLRNLSNEYLKKWL